MNPRLKSEFKKGEQSCAVLEVRYPTDTMFSSMMLYDPNMEHGN